MSVKPVIAPDRMGAWLNLIQANRVVAAALEEQLQLESGLSLAEHETLARIAETPDGKLRMAELASLLLVSKSGATRIVDRLEEAGLVRRDVCLSDRRVTYAALTPQGREVLDRSMPVLRRGLERSFSVYLADTDVASLRRALRKVLEGHGKWDESRCSPGFGAERRETSSPATR